jgi:hypothetical protein
MKKGLSLVLVLAMVLGCFSFVSAASYSDVAGTSYEEAVARLSLLEILTGYNDGTFKPENQITRAEFAAVAVRAKGLEATAQASKGLPTGFSDVPGTHWASGYVGTAAKMGIVNGVGNGQFAPAAPVKYEEAITMIVRALGYEPSAQVRGGYPYGYLIVANENGLLDDVKGTQGAPALRGEVAQIVDNALEIPMMVQVGYGTDTKWVVSGSKEHGGDERYLLDDMGFDSVKGRVTSVNTKTNKITVEPEDDDKVVIEAADDFDFYSVEGLVTKFWYKNDTVVVYVVKDEAKFDAVSYDEDEKELTLITEDENYEVAKDAILRVDDEKVKASEFEADYAKIVLNDDDEIVFAEGYTLDGYVVVDEVKDDKIAAYGDDELDVEDFLIVKEGKTIKAEDLEDGEVVFYNDGEEFAVVATASKTGKIDRVYSDGFRFEGKTYNYTNVKYFDGENLDDVDKDVLDEVVEDEDEIVAIFNFKNKVAVLKGEDKDPDASSFYAVLIKDSKETTGRRNEKFLSIDVRAADGTKKAYDLDTKFVEKHELGTTDTPADGIKEVGDVIKITVDKDGDPSKIVIVEDKDEIKADFKVTATYAKGEAGDYKITPSTVVFYKDNDKAIKVGDIKDEFEQIKVGGYIFHEAGKAVAIVSETNADADTKNVVGLLGVVKELNDGRYEFRIKVAGKSETYVTEKDDFELPAGITVGTNNIIAKLEVGEKSEKVVSATATVSNSGLVVIESVSGKKLTDDNGKKYELTDSYKIYDANDNYAEIKGANKLVDKEVKLYFDGNSKTYVNYVIVDDKVDDTTTADGILTDINKADSEIEIESANGKVTVYKLTGSARNLIVDEDTLVDGIQVGDSVKLTFTGDRVTGIKLVKAAADIAKEAEEKVVKAELAKVKSSYEVANSEANIKDALEDLIENDVDTDKVTVSLTEVEAGVKYTVKLTSKNTDVTPAIEETKTVTVTKAAASKDATLSAIRVNGIKVSNFSSSKANYTVSLDERPAVKPTVTYDCTNEFATPEVIDDNKNITAEGSDTKLVVTITVTAEDEETVKVYTVTINVPEAE